MVGSTHLCTNHFFQRLLFLGLVSPFLTAFARSWLHIIEFCNAPPGNSPVYSYAAGRNAIIHETQVPKRKTVHFWGPATKANTCLGAGKLLIYKGKTMKDR